MPLHIYFTRQFLFGYKVIAQYMATQMRKHTEEPQEYELQDIIDQMQNGKKTFYLVKWKGYSDKYNTWQPRSHLANVPEKLREWSKKKQARKRKEFASKKVSTETSTDSDLDRHKHKKSKHTDREFSQSESHCKNSLIRDMPKQLRSKEGGKMQVNQHAKSSNLSTAINSKFSQIKHGPIGQNVQKKLLEMKKSVKKTLQEYEKAERLLKKKAVELERFSDKIFDTDIILSEKSGRKLKQDSKNIKNKSQSSIFQRQQQLLKNLQARKIILEKTDVNEDQDLIIIEQSDQVIQQSVSEDSEHSRHSEAIVNERVQQAQELSVQRYEQQEKQASEKPASQKEVAQPDNLFDLSYEQAEDLILPGEEELLSVTPLPKIAERYGGDNLNIFFQEPDQSAAIQRTVDYTAMQEINTMYKCEGIVFCEVETRDGILLEKVAFSELQEHRPDLLCSFFNQEYPAKAFEDVIK